MQTKPFWKKCKNDFEKKAANKKDNLWTFFLFFEKKNGIYFMRELEEKEAQKD